MNVSMSAWLQHKIDEYTFAIRDITADFYRAQAELDCPGCTIEQLRKFNHTCLDMAELCQLNGDDRSYLHALGKLHQRLVVELSNTSRERLFRMQAWQLARHSLSRLCHKLMLDGEWNKATVLLSEFVQHASRII
ncbi:hypothetical protein BN439_2062 [Erwinia amylovora Ea644]|uniref:hypothetical protein n=1 Tax=Erwinia amylovora TaxID=552 RepID=UPI0002CC2A21|nr:hypothetical protein [Erwinia amylovora]CCP03121.1 hypothetical protein BN439_2062 [Erwinia amylovora Ea644]CCP07121.1 hypothetical protein BN440_2096 [Erwinia amylovora MR1]